LPAHEADAALALVLGAPDAAPALPLIDLLERWLR